MRAASQRDLLRYQYELNSQVTWKDILGVAGNVGGMALGGWLGGV